MQAEMLAVLNEIEAALPLMTWKRAEMPGAEAAGAGDARAFEGVGGEWRLTVASFDIESQGFPAGSRGYDGAAASMSRGLVTRLTRELAERAFTLALSAAPTAGV